MRRREALGLYPLRDLKRGADHGAWTATGPAPTFAFGPHAAVTALSGTRIRLRSRPDAVHPVLAVAVEGEAEPRRYRLTRRAGGTDDLIRLPPGLRALRLEATEANPGFRLDAVTVAPAGRIEAGLVSARTILERLPPQERRPLRLLRRAFGLLRSVPPGEIWRRLTRAAATRRPPARYADWIATVETPALPPAQAAAALLAALPDRPLISVLMAEDTATPADLSEAVASLRAQFYPDWELLLVAAPSEPLRALAAEEPRLRLLSPEGATPALDAALAEARGSFVAPMPPDARLAPQALLAVARRLAAEPGHDMLYSDEDRIGADGERCDPHFKPDWSPETLEAGFYTGGLALYRTALARAVGGFPAESAGAEVYDLTLRLTERTDRVGHIPQMLCHRRSAGIDPEAATRALAGRARRTGGLGSIRVLAPGHFALRREPRQRPLVSIVIPTAGRDTVIGGRTIDLLAA
ncbi:glycosyltransferase, partial [Methylorubrum zatmanii]